MFFDITNFVKNLRMYNGGKILTQVAFESLVTRKMPDLGRTTGETPYLKLVKCLKYVLGRGRRYDGITKCYPNKSL